MIRSIRAGMTEVLIGPLGELGGTERIFNDIAEADSYLRALVDDAAERTTLRELVVADGIVSIMLSDDMIRQAAAERLVSRQFGVREVVRAAGGLLFRSSVSYMAPASPSLPHDRLSLPEIERTYTVPVDTMVVWSPIPVLGQLFDSTTAQITATEARLLDGLSLSMKVSMNAMANLAREIAKTHFPTTANAPPWVPPDRYKEWIGNDGHRDALRHSLWNALMCAVVGQSITEAFATAHEGAPDNQPARMAMDLYNNQQGRRIARLHPFTDPEATAIDLRQAMDRGELLVFDQGGRLAWCNQVERYQHGLVPRPAPGP